MSLVDEVTKLMNDAIKLNPIALAASTGLTAPIDPSDVCAMVELHAAALLGQRRAILHIARQIDEA